MLLFVSKTYNQHAHSYMRKLLCLCMYLETPKNWQCFQNNSTLKSVLSSLQLPIYLLLTASFYSFLKDNVKLGSNYCAYCLI